MKTEASEPSMMHHAVSSSVPAFLAKLWAMVNEESTDAVIGWTECNKSFYIRNQSVFSMELLPVYYKHNNMASFVRQLNMYGFRKVLSPMAGSLRNESDEMIFAHPDFVRDEPWGLENIKRKIPHHKDLPHASGELIARLYSEVKSMKSKQDSLDSHLNKMKRENESLWREVLVLRQKHAKQQQIVNKVIQFLVPFLQSGRAPTSTFMGLKRKQLPMLEDGGGDVGEPSSKAPRLQRTYSMDENMAASIDNRSIASTAGSPGPVIHEVTDAVTSPAAAAAPGTSSTQQQQHMTQDEFLASSTGPESTVDWTPLVENLPAGPSGDFSPAEVPAPATAAEDAEENQQQQQQQQPQDTTVALTVSPDPNQEPTPVLCDSLLESIQADLEGLRGLMGSPNWRIDTSSVQNILSNPDQALTASASGGESDQQLITYNPSLLDLFTSESDDLFPDLRGLEEDEDEAVPQPALAGPAATASGAGDAGAQSSGLNTPTVEMRGGPVFPANPTSGGGRKSAFASATPAGEAGKEMAPMGGRRSELNTPTIEVPRTAFPVVTGKASKQGKRRK